MIGTMWLSLALSLPGADAPKGTKITFEEHVLPIMKDKCAGCHNLDKKRGGLIVNNYTQLMAGGSSGVAVKPGDPDNSLLYRVMTHAQEPFMPPKADKLPQKDLDTVQKWIAGGAPENSGSKVVMIEKPKTDFSLKSAARGKPEGAPPMPPATLSLAPVVKSPLETAVTSMAASPWAPLLAVGGQKQVLLYHADTLDLLGILPFPEGTPQVLRFSRNGSLLLAGGGRAGKAGKVAIWSVEKGERLFTLGDESDCVIAADISPDQSLIALGGPGKMVRIYSARDGKLLHEIKKHTDWVTALEFSPDGVLLSTGDRNGGLFVWEAFTAREYFALKGPTGAITEISWRPDSNMVAASSEDGTIRLFEMENGGQAKSWGAHGGGALSVRFGQDGRIASCGRDRVTKLWDANGNPQKSFDALPDITLRSLLSHDGKRIIASDWNGSIAVWNTVDGKRVGSLSANPPTPAEQLALFQQQLEQKTKLVDDLTQQVKSGEAQLNQTQASLAAAQKAAGAQLEMMKVAEAKLNQAKVALDAAQKASKSAAQEVKAKETLSQALGEALVKVRQQAEKEKDNPLLQQALARATALSSQASTEYQLAMKNQQDMQGALKSLEVGTSQAQATWQKHQADHLAATKSLPGLDQSAKALATKFTADKAALEQTAQDLNRVKAGLGRWQAVVASMQKTGK